MATSATQDQVAQAAKVIRILHSNHAAASDYVHSVYETSTMSRGDFRSHLRFMPLEDYKQLVGDLSKDQKAILFDKVARMNEKSATETPRVDPKTTKTFFKMLRLKHKGLSLDDVRKAVENPPSRPVEVKPAPRKEEGNKRENKRKREENTPNAAPARLEPVTTDHADRPSKKQRTEPLQPPSIPAIDPSASKSKRKREIKKAKIDGPPKEGPQLAQSARNEVTQQEPSVQKITSPAQIAPLQEARRTNGIAVQGTETAETSTRQQVSPPESATPTQRKQKKSRRSRRKPKAAQIPQDKAEPTPVQAKPSSLQAESHCARTASPTSEASAEAGGLPRSITRTTLPLTGKPVISATAHDTVELMMSETRLRSLSPDAEKENILPNGEDRQPSPDEVAISPRGDQKSLSPEVLERSPSGETEVPAHSAEEPSEKLNGSSQEDAGNGLHLEEPQQSLSPKHRETSSSPVKGERSFSLPAVPIKPTTKQKRDSSPTLRLATGSSNTGSSTDYDERAGGIAFGASSSQSDVPSNSHRKQLKLSKPASFVSTFSPAVSARPLHRPNPLLGFGSFQSPAPSVRSTTNSTANLSGAESFRSFSAFLKGKRPDEDDSTSEDESSSSSSDSDSDDEVKPPLKSSQIAAVVPETEKQEEPIKESPVSETGVKPTVSDEQETSTHPEDTVTAFAPSAMDVDIKSEPEDVQEHPEAPAETMDVCMPNIDTVLDTPVEEVGPTMSVKEGHVEPSIEDVEEADVTFHTFHENDSPDHVPEPSPIPELQDLMEFGGYIPSPLVEEHTSEPVNHDPAVMPDLTHPPSNQLGEQPNDQAMNDSTEVSEHASEERLDAARTSSPMSDYDTSLDAIDAEEPVENLDPYLAAFAEAGEQLESRIASQRDKLEQDVNDSPENNKSVLELLMASIKNEEAMYTSKIEAARRHVERQPEGSRERLSKVIDHAENDFTRRIKKAMSTLTEEHDAESARSQLSPRKRGIKVEPQDNIPSLAPYRKVKIGVSSPIPDSSPGPDSASDDLDWRGSGDEEPKSQRKTRKTTGAKSNHFPTPSPKKKRVPAGTSAVPFPKLSAPRFGLIQEELADDPFRLIIAVTFLNKTAGRSAVPIFRQIMEKYPTPKALADAEPAEISPLIHSLGFQNKRAKKLVKIAKTWVENPPRKGIRHRTFGYPHKEDGRNIKPKGVVEEDADNCAGALEVGHIFGTGAYAWDSWRIFCRDKLRGVADGYNGEGVQGYADSPSQSDFEPEWKRVVPLDKELRACLRWMWLREGWEWDPLTGEKKVANVELMRKASEGVAVWDEPVAVNPHGLRQSESSQKVAEELESPAGPDALVPGIKAEDAVASIEAPPAFTPAPKMFAEPEILTSRLRPRRGRSAAANSTPTLTATPAPEEVALRSVEAARRSPRKML